MGRNNNAKRGVNPRHWKQWVKNNRQNQRKCEKYFPTITVEEGKAKFKEIIEKTRKNGYYRFHGIKI